MLDKLRHFFSRYATPIGWSIGKLEIKPDDVLVVRFHESVPAIRLHEISKFIKERIGIRNVLVFDSEVDFCVVTRPTPRAVDAAAGAQAEGASNTRRATDA